jgi:class 3 adenylate cyclase/predicted ATPase
MSSQSEIEKIQQAIQALEAQRHSLGEAVVETALAPLRVRLASLQAGSVYEQRKQVSVLFADLVGSTALTTRLDAEDMRELLNAYFERCRQSIEAHGGVVEKFIGDAVMAVFGLHISREDDPQRAIQAGLEISRLPTHLHDYPAFPDDLPVATRVGIHTGELVVGALGERQEGELVVVGETVNLASRLQGAAPPGGVLITHASYRHVRGVFEVQPLEPLTLKGFAEPVKAYLVKAAKPRAFRIASRGVEGVETTMVGRGAELEQLRDAFHTAVGLGRLQTVTVLGEAGIGKSRLLEELEAWLELLLQRIYYFKGRAYPAMQTTPYSLLRDLFAFRFQIHDSDPPPVVQNKLEQGYAQAFSGGVERDEGNSHRKATRILGRLLGFELTSAGKADSPEQDARSLLDQAMLQLRDYFHALGQSGPLVVLLEDLHWADDSSLDLLHRMGGWLERLPLLLVTSARPSLLERRPDWEQALPAQRLLRLSALTQSDSRQLVEQILWKVQDLPPSLSDLVVLTAEGNPFYIEELLKMLIEDGIIHAQGERWQVESKRLVELRVPPTLLGVLQARFDSLTPDERLYLQRGSVIGRVFWDRAIEHLTGAGGSQGPLVHELPRRLRAREMIYERERSTFEETHEYLFKHALLRDVTYQSLLKRQRRHYHRRAAEWLEQVTERSGRADEFASLIAGHYEQAGEPSQAADWYWRAGLSATRRYANAEALHAFTRTLALTPTEDRQHQFEVRLQIEKVYDLQGAQAARQAELEQLHVLAEALNDPLRRSIANLRQASYELSVSNFPGVITSAGQARDLASSVQADEVAAESDLLCATALMRQGSLEQARTFAERALDQAQLRTLHSLEAASQRHLGLIEYYAGNHDQARHHFAQALELYRETGDRQGESATINNLGGANFEMGEHAQAKNYYSQSLQLSREIGDRLGEARATNNLGIISVVQSDYASAEQYYLQALDIFREIGHRSFEMSALDNLGNLALYRYQFSKARRYQLEALHGARQIGDRVNECYSLINLARGSLMTGDYPAALAYIQTGLERAREIGDLQGECNLLLDLVYYHLGIGQVESAYQVAHQALEQAQQGEFKSELGWVYELLGQCNLASGQAQEAATHFQAALHLRRELGESGESYDSQSSLAQALLALGDVGGALQLIDELQAAWETEGVLGMDQPVNDLLISYRVLEAAGDPRAAGQLERGYRLLQECAANIEEPDLRQRFLQNIPANRELARLWAEKTAA